MPQKDDSSFIIRKYIPSDRPAVRRICCETALMGEPSIIFFEDDKIFADALTVYFTDHEPESCFVLECGESVVGYLLGAKDARQMNRVFLGKIALPLLVNALWRGTYFHRKNSRFLFSVIVSLLKGEFRTPELFEDYPAILHINILKEYRMAGLGSKLINAYIDHLRSQAVKGVCLATMSDAAGRFFSKLGFQLLFQGERSYLRYILKKNIPVYIYGMRIPA